MSAPALPVILGADAVRDLLARLDPVAEMRFLFAALGAEQAVQPPQVLTEFPGGKGDFITYTGVLAAEGVFGVKVSPYIVGAQGSHVTAWTLLMSATTGDPLLLCDSRELTVARTAATTALAVDLLARDDAQVLAIIGSGAQARAHLHLVRGLRHWREIRLTSPRLARHTAPLPAGVTAVADHRAAVAGADVILCCTSSGTPVIEPQHVGHPALITSISTNVALAHEVDPALLASMDVYCDYRRTTPTTAGEMILAARAGWSVDAIRGDLGELLTHTAPRPAHDRHVFFRSVGLGLEDVALALAIHRLHQQEPVA